MKKVCIMIAILKMNFLMGMDVPQQQWTKVKKIDHPGIISARFNSSGQKIITTTALKDDNYAIGICDLQSGESNRYLETKLDNLSVCLDKNETRLYVVAGAGDRWCYDLTTKNEVWHEVGPKIWWGVPVFSYDQTKFMIEDDKHTLLIDAMTGKQEAVLWKSPNDNAIATAGFYKNTSQVFVLHNGFLNDHESTEMIRYEECIPQGSYCPMYLKNNHEVLYFSKEKNLCEIVDIATASKKQLSIIPRVGAMHCFVSLGDNDKKLLRSSFCSREDIDFGAMCWVDAYNLEKCSCIAAIACSSEPTKRLFNSKKRLLLLPLRNKLELWNVDGVQHKMASLRYDRTGWLKSVSINDEGDTIFMADEDGISIWKNS